MRTTSNRLSELARAIGLSNPEGDITDLQIPPVVDPVLEFPNPIDTALPGITTDVQRSSWGTNFGLQQGASAATVIQTIATLGRGLWDISVQLYLFADYRSASANAEGLIRLFFAGPQTGLGIVGLKANALGPSTGTNKIRVLVANDTTTVEVRREATGVAQTFDLFVSLYCAKLL